jgi:hypothetical protein
MTSGTLLLNGVAFDLALMNSIPANVKVACSYQDQYCEYINSADSTGSPYTVEVGAGLNNGYYTAKDSENRICFTSTVYENVMQNTLNSGANSINVKQMAVTSYYPIIVNQSDVTITAEKGTTLTMPNLAAAVTVTANIDVGDSTIELSDTSAFRVGQYITYTDDTYATHYGDSAGRTCLVTSVSASSVGISPVIQSGETAAVSSNARAIPAYGFFFISYASNVCIDGFTLNGNNANRARIYAIAAGTSGAQEQRSADMGITALHSSDVTIQNNNIYNMTLHGIMMDAVSSYTIQYNNISYSEDKNILLLASSDQKILNNNIISPIREDGIISYYLGIDLTIRDNYIYMGINNSRYGILTRSNNTKIIGNTLIGLGNEDSTYIYNAIVDIESTCYISIISENIFRNFGKAVAFKAVGATQAHVSDNEFTGGATAIWVTGATVNSTFSGNTMTNMKTYGILESAPADWNRYVDNSANKPIIYIGANSFGAANYNATAWCP